MNFKKPKKSKFWKIEKKITGDIIILHVYQKPQSYEILFLRYEEWKNENFKTILKTPGDTIILHNCTKNNDHRLYCSWDMARDRCNCYFSFWAIFCPFTHLKAQKIKFLKKSKNNCRYHHFIQVYQNVWCTVSGIWCMTDGRTEKYVSQHNKGQCNKRKEINIFRNTVILQIHNYLISLPAKSER